MKNSFYRFSNKNNENQNNLNNTPKSPLYQKNSNNTERLNKTTYENINFKERSYSPITHKKNLYVEEYAKIKNCPMDNDSKDNKYRNLNYFDEFNVIYFLFSDIQINYFYLLKFLINILKNFIFILNKF